MLAYAWVVANLAIHRWSWGGLLSPSAAFCFSITLYSVFFPLQGMMLAMSALTADVRYRTLITLGVLLLIFVSPLITDTLIWGSFPFTYDSEGIGRLRFIPFVPWPSGGYGAL